MKVDLVKGNSTDQWLPKHWRKTTIPVLRQPCKSSDDLNGSAFVLQYDELPYIVTAKHVIEIEAPSLVFVKNNKHIIGVSSIQLQHLGLKWINHPAGLDLSAIPFPLPLLKEDLDLTIIREEDWVTQSKIKIDDWIVHLGYPSKEQANYTNGSPAPFPIGMPGPIIGLERLYFIMQTAAAPGASGGPVFLRREKKPPLLIGVVVEQRHQTLKNGGHISSTRALVISLIKDVLESEDMNEMRS